MNAGHAKRLREKCNHRRRLIVRRAKRQQSQLRNLFTTDEVDEVFARLRAEGIEPEVEQAKGAAA